MLVGRQVTALSPERSPSRGEARGGCGERALWPLGMAPSPLGCISETWGTFGCLRCIPTDELPQGQPSAKLTCILGNGMSQSGSNLGVSLSVQFKPKLS